MSTRLVTVPVDTISPNPWRNGKGTATWESIQDAYPITDAKIDRLKESMAKGTWEGAIAREVAPGAYQLAFGHHRRCAFWELVDEGRVEDAFPLIVKDLTDAEMLSHMARENAEEDGHSFPIAVINPVEALVTAFDAGKVTQGDGPGQLKAPGKTAGHVRSLLSGEETYTAGTLSDFLGIQVEKVTLALRAVDAFDAGLLSRDKLAPMRGAVVPAIKAAEAEEKRADAEWQAKISIRKENRTLALAQGNKIKAAEEQGAIDNMEVTRVKSTKLKARSAGDMVGTRIIEGTATLSQIIEEQKVQEAKASKTPPDIAKRLVAYTSDISKVGREDTPGWNAACLSEDLDAKEDLAVEMEMAEKRLANRRKTLRGGQK